MGPERTREIKSFGTAHRVCVRACVRAHTCTFARRTVRPKSGVHEKFKQSQKQSVTAFIQRWAAHLDEFVVLVIWRHVARIIRG